MTRAIRLVTLALLSVAAMMLAASPALCAQKAALVIGNGAYRSVTPLVNPPNDANDMAASLGHIGYAVTLVKDGDLQAMNDGLRAFLRDADHADSVVIFYSGHGVQVKGHNYLIPISAKIADELDLDTQAISLDKLLDLVDSAAPKVKIVILDSCRDNPLTRTLVRGAGTRGLARIDLDASSAKGTLIAFSTAPGSVAQDGTGRNSPFTQALLAHMETPGLDIRQMFGQVRADVDQSTQGGQTPWVNEAIIGSFAMAGTVTDPQPVKTIQVVPQAQPETAGGGRFRVHRAASGGTAGVHSAATAGAAAGASFRRASDAGYPSELSLRRHAECGGIGDLPECQSRGAGPDDGVDLWNDFGSSLGQRQSAVDDQPGGLARPARPMR